MPAHQPGSVTEFTLDNGLKLLLKEDHSAPIASIWTWYRVGSRNELPGKTGISHWVEHMQFKGTPTIAKGQIFRDVSRVGGTLNALTSQDWTAYFETLPVQQIDLALQIESDRMVNSLFDAQEVESERTVILSERQGSENNPGYALYEEVTGAAFQAHPYRHMVIGYESDLRQITRDDLYGHYRRYYHPANAFIAAVGDFQTEDLIYRISDRFGAIAAGEQVARDIRVREPLQPGERSVAIRKPSGAPYLRWGFHAPAASETDFVPLLVTEAILSGGPPMGLGGGGAMGRSSRLFRSLVASGLARGAGSDMSVTIDPYLFQIGVTALPDSDLDLVERTVAAELASLSEGNVTAEELTRAVRQLEAQFVYSSEGVTNQAFWLGQWEIVDHWERAHSLQEEIRAVTAEDVQRVAAKYLVPERRTFGKLIPTVAPSAAHTPLEDEPAAFTPLAWGLSGPIGRGNGSSQGFQRALLDNGIPVLGQNRPDSGSVALRMRVPAGMVLETDDQFGLAQLTGRAVMRGSGGMTFEQISMRTDDLGSSIGIDPGRFWVEGRVRCLRDDLPEMSQLLAQTLLRPDFPTEEVEKVKAEQAGAITEANNDTRATADRLMRRAVYPEPNPLGRRASGSIELVGSYTDDDVRTFHRQNYRPVGSTIAIVGGINDFEHALEVLNESFGAWAATSPPDWPSYATVNDEALRVTETIPGKSQADLALGATTISRNDPDYYALDVANLILGRLGLMGRLGAEVRDRQGMAYYVFSQIETRRDGSLWTARAGVDPGNIERAIAGILAELARIRQELVTEEELEDAKSNLIGVLPLALESHDGVASTLLGIEEFNLGLDYLDRYPAIINAITREHVLAAASAHLRPDRLVESIALPA